MRCSNSAARVTALALALAVLPACSTSRPMTLGAVQSSSSGTAPVTVLQRNVSATDCPNPGDMYGDYNDAAQAAIDLVPGADALANVRFAVKDTVGHYCLRVTGDAVQLP